MQDTKTHSSTIIITSWGEKKRNIPFTLAIKTIITINKQKIYNTYIENPIKFTEFTI